MVVQSSTATPAEVTRSMSEFLYQTADKLLSGTSAQEVASYVSAARAYLLQKPTSLSEAAEPYWSHVLDESHNFKRREKLAAQLAAGTVSVASLKAMHQFAIGRNPDGTTSKKVGRLLTWILARKGAAVLAPVEPPDGYTQARHARP